MKKITNNKLKGITALVTLSACLPVRQGVEGCWDALRGTTLIRRKLKGMTLIELLLVLALIGILLSMAVPKLMPLIGRTKSMEAQMQLKHVFNLEKNYFYINSKYTSNLDDIGFEQSKLVTQDGKANYKIEIIEASNNSFIAKATSVTDFDQDGQLNVWQVNHEEEIKEITKD